MSTRARMPSMNARSAPASRYMLQRLMASSMPQPAKTSVRALMMKSLSNRSRTAAQARILPAISSAGMTSLPAMWPQRLGKTWSSMFMPARPMAMSPLRDPGGVDGVAAAGVEIGHDRDPDRLGDVPGEVEDVLHPDEADVGLAEEGPRQAVAGDLDGLEPALFDDLGAQGVVTAGDDDRPPLHDGLSENTRLFHYELLYYGFPP